MMAFSEDGTLGWIASGNRLMAIRETQQGWQVIASREERTAQFVALSWSEATQTLIAAQTLGQVQVFALKGEQILPETTISLAAESLQLVAAVISPLVNKPLRKGWAKISQP